MFSLQQLAAAGGAMVLAASLAAAPTTPTVDFQKQIRPILSENCFQCHGPDGSTRMAGLRLDTKEAVLEARRRGAAVVPGKPESSLIYQRMVATDPARKMPPEQAHKKLTAEQIGTVKRWIEQGAPWKEHWAFQPIAKPVPPTVAKLAAHPGWTINPIDRFLLAKMQSLGLTPNKEADRRTLIRRAALDLTGLPPSAEAVEQFVKDRSANAYEKMVDALLASPRYGEHRARYWLDAARYADTHGIHVDNYREMWAYRDWVIQAFNRNLPFDQFTLEQLAGDMLPNRTLEQQIATGFQRCNPTSNEAGLIEDEYAEIYAKDRADTIGAVYLGMTVGCATCHDHKFDPISQKDFYSLGAFFRNTTQKVMDGNVPDTPPILLVPAEPDRPRWAVISSRLKQLQTEMLTRREAAGPAFAQWLQQFSATRQKADTREPNTVRPLEASAELYRLEPAALPANPEVFTLAASDLPGRQAVTFRKDEGVAVSQPVRLDADQPFSISLGFFFPKAEQGYTLVSQQDPKDKNRGWVISVGSRVMAFQAFGDEGKNIEVRAGHLEQIQHGTWNHLVITYDGSRHQSGLNMYLNGRAIPTQGRGNQNVELKGSIAVTQPLLLGRALREGAISELRILNREVTESEAYLLQQWPRIDAALRKPSAEWTSADQQALLAYYLFANDEPFNRLRKEQTELQREARAIARRGAITHVMEEASGQMPFAHVLYRGAYDQRRQRVEADTPAVLPPMTADLPRNRLGLAKWLMRADNPVTARVTVNRMWQEIFGTGIVKTTDDFGSQGEPPTHPELLDWLAADFRDNGWDVKRFYRQVLLSAAYRQSAASTEAKQQKDPENRYLSRGPRFRMDAEMVRDYALAASGLLSTQIGGPSAKPYQPEGVWEAVAMIGSNTRFYKPDSGDKLYRRSLYTFWKRSAPPASMEIFNAPSRENCTVRRERTNTPLQALVTMNDTQFVEAARLLAARAMQQAGPAATLPARLDHLSRPLLARLLSPAEKAIAQTSYQKFLSYYDANPADAKKLLAVGESQNPPGLNAAEHAALTMLANQLFNLDEVLVK